MRSGIVAVQECKLSESDVGNCAEHAKDLDYWIDFGPPCTLASGAINVTGRQVAIMTSKTFSSARPTKICSDEDEHVALLNASGRWVERLIAVSGGGEHIVVACLYGYAGASNCRSKYQDNERLIAAATARMTQLGRVPYFICTDLNVDPRDSECVAKGRRLGMIHDVVAERTVGELPMTYNSSRDIREGMTGKGTSRIDRLWIQTDNQQVEQVFAGRSFLKSANFRPLCVRISRSLLACLEPWKPRTEITPLIEWDPRSWNTLADHAANATLDGGADWTQYCDSRQDPGIELGAVNLRLCFHGALRGDGSSSAGFALLAYSSDNGETTLFRGGRLLGKLTSAFMAEMLALECTLLIFCDFLNITTAGTSCRRASA
jgi:hypothetical protein